MAKVRGQRTAESYLSRDPEKRERSLANLRQNWGKSRLRRIKGDLPRWDIEAYAGDIVKFSEQFVIPETQAPIILEDWQVDNFFKPVFYEKEKPSLALLSLCKKNGKSCLAALCVLYTFFCGEPLNEIYICAHDKDQGNLIIFNKVKMAVQFNPVMMVQCRIREDYLEHVKTGTVIRVLPNDWRSSAGLNPGMIVIDELFGFDLEAAERFYNELQLGPTRKDPLTLVTSTAGYSEEGLLWELWQKGLKNIRGEPGYNSDYYSFISHDNLASWVTDKWLSKQKKKMRASLYKRLHKNEWTSGEEAFISDDAWDACVDRKHRPMLPNKEVSVVVGVDASYKKDSTACVAVTRREDKIVLVAHRSWQPSGKEPFDLETTIEAYVKQLAEDYIVKEVRYDPFQMHRSATTLAKDKINMVEFPQTQDRLTSMSQNLFDLISGGNLVLYEDREMRLAAQRSVAIESSRGFRLVKKKASHKIDLIIALAMAALGATEQKPKRKGRVYIVGED